MQENLKEYNPSGNKLLVHHWTDIEINDLKNLYIIKSWCELAKHFNRPERSIRLKIKNLGLPDKIKRCDLWTEKENNNLIDLYNKKYKNNIIAQKLNRTERAVKVHLNRLGIARNSSLERRDLSHNNFYISLRHSLSLKTSGGRCCLCNYNLFIDLHHIDGNRNNHKINNIASLCPNHHREVERGMHKDKELYCIWWRIYPDNIIGDIFNNKQFIGIDAVPIKDNKYGYHKVREIKKMIDDGVPTIEISKLFNVSHESIKSIKRGETFSNITGIQYERQQQNPDNVKQAKRLLQEGKFTQREIAKICHISETNVSMIKSGKIWKNIQI
jgi:DNA-binding CsgD family transcriptional regulator